jgi:hypothetical protein
MQLMIISIILRVHIGNAQNMRPSTMLKKEKEKKKRNYETAKDRK